ncbi:CvpA family protein [Roseateles koreensis]|uniref:CvpA family protein n=1 Tax=Roseateles koreensis TaxID=2987526 RepID=A0ABT5KTE1_9BURK|nr:CvpA family protein [Roseateles koreensis]MDC8786212.1 CvpA family protein [Roseateles koreensis]
MVWVDYVFLAIGGVSVLMGVWRGLVFEVLSLAGWLVAYVAMPFVAPYLAGVLPQERLGQSATHVLSLGLSFLLVLLVWGVCAKLLRGLIHATPLSLVDRLAGAGFGLLRGLLICVAAVLVVSMTPAVKSEIWTQSQLVPGLKVVLQVARPALPEEVLKWIPA